MSEINITPFVDVMLVLLIIFMVAAPLLTVGVPVELPKTAANALPGDQEEPLTVTITAAGESAKGTSRLARMPSGPHSSAAARVSMPIAAFAAA